MEPYNLARANGIGEDQLYGISLMNGIITRKDIMDRMIDKIKQRCQFYEPINWDDFKVYSQFIHSGVYFCQGTLNELRRSGATTAQAFTSLIKNPPSVLEQFKDPVRYAQGLK